MSSAAHRVRLLAIGFLPFLLSGLLEAREQPAADPILYVFAHQDDEVFIVGKMHAEVEAGREVHAVWITDGARDGNPLRREQESRAVMAMVGLPESHLHFLRFPDHGSHRHLGAIYEALLVVAQSRPFTEIDSPAYEGGNIDHDVAALMASRLAAVLPRRPAHYEFPLYNRYRGRRQIGVFLPHPDSEIQFVPLEGARRELVLRALKTYRSQRLLLVLMEIAGQKKVLLARGEPYRRAPAYDFLRRPIDETCGYEVSGLHRARFSDWRREVALFLDRAVVAVNDDE